MERKGNAKEKEEEKEKEKSEPSEISEISDKKFLNESRQIFKYHVM
jgi:hypothetical protein